MFIIQVLKLKTINVVRNRETIGELKEQLRGLGAEVVLTEEEARQAWRELPRPRLALFTRIVEASFRGQVKPGDTFLLLAEEIRVQEKKFESNIQGMVNGKVVYEAQISGISPGELPS